MKFNTILSILLLFLIFYGCTSTTSRFVEKGRGVVPDYLESRVMFLTNKSFGIKTPTVITNPIVTSPQFQEENITIKYFGYEQVNNQEVVKLNGYLNHTKKFQALLYQNELINFSNCGKEVILNIANILKCENSECKRGIELNISYNGENSIKPIRGETEAVQISCTSVEIINSTLADQRESDLVYVGSKTFRKQGDMLRDDACYFVQNSTLVNIIPFDFWNKESFIDFPLKRYLFRPNTIVCDGKDTFFLRESEYSKQCNTWLGKRSDDSVACKNLNSLIEDTYSISDQN
ncbi:MAG: hypothetical protein Q7S22_03935 [Candidatus Micrarchaeota archaeon]|nr:hypothetical protein [Candidatus Micrarchaeota archaeon]